MSSSERSSRRFLVFAFDGYYPRGGWEDLVATAETREEAEAIAKVVRRETVEIVDLEDPSEFRWVDKHPPPRL